MLNDLMNTKEINWVMDKSAVEVPFDDIDYKEYSFNGNLPSYMANKIKATIKPNTSFNKNTISEIENGIQRILTIKFGTTRQTQNRVTFFYTTEVL